METGNQSGSSIFLVQNVIFSVNGVLRRSIRCRGTKIYLILTHFFHAQFVNKTAKTFDTNFVKSPATQSLRKISLFTPAINSMEINEEWETNEIIKSLLKHFNGWSCGKIDPINLNLFTSWTISIYIYTQCGFQSEHTVFFLHVSQ